MSKPRIDLDQSIYIANIMFPDDFCDQCITIYKHKQKLANSIMQHNNAPFRKDTSLFLDDGYLDMMSEAANLDLVQEVNYHLTTALHEYQSMFGDLGGMTVRSVRQKLQKTQKAGGYHVWHHEQQDIDSATRVLVWTIYLNDVEEGGETEFLYQSQRVKARKGKIVIFPAGFTHTHRGNPPLSGDKYILTGWWNII